MDLKQNKKFKVLILISLQISIIIGSFLVISQFTIQSEFLGNSINLSGSNRFLGEHLLEHTEQYRLGYVDSPPYHIMSSIDSNLHLLENGGNFNDFFEVNDSNIVNFDYSVIMPIPNSLTSELNQLKSSWQNYKNYILDEISSPSELDLYTNTELLALKSEFIQSANLITLELSNYSSMEKSDLYLIQTALLFVNIGAHVFLLYLIYNILTKEKLVRSQSQKIQRRHQKLVNEFQDLLIQKNSIQLTSALLLEELQEIQKRTNELSFNSEEDEIQYFWNNFYQNVLKRLKDLEASKKMYDDEKSYYEQLNNRFKNALDLLDKKNIKTANNESIDYALDSLRDLINSMSETGRISPKNNRILTDVLNQIIDSNLGQKDIKVD